MRVNATSFLIGVAALVTAGCVSPFVLPDWYQEGLGLGLGVALQAIDASDPLTICRVSAQRGSRLGEFYSAFAWLVTIAALAGTLAAQAVPDGQAADDKLPFPIRYLRKILSIAAICLVPVAYCLYTRAAAAGTWAAAGLEALASTSESECDTSEAPPTSLTVDASPGCDPKAAARPAHAACVRALGTYVQAREKTNEKGVSALTASGGAAPGAR